MTKTIEYQNDICLAGTELELAMINILLSQLTS
jgi:hypothetical protein